MSVTGPCPSCGATVEFTAARSVVTVCDSCSSVVGRSGDAFENYGKVAELVRTDSPLQIGTTGAYRGRPFEIVGRVQLKHPSGAVWDEWYATFGGGETWGWISEAQGKIHVTFPKRIHKFEETAGLGELAAGESLMIPSVGQFRIAEIATATIGFADGEIPYVVRPGTTYRFADLEGSGGRFATIDFRGRPPLVFVGQRVTYEQLGVARLESREEAIPEAGTVAVNCPSCGGSLELRAPDATQRVVCPYCDSLHDVAQGNLKYLEKLTQGKWTPLIPLGTEGELRGKRYVVIGHLRRQVTYEGTAYPWDEYLLAAKREPFRWLIHANDHWNLGEAVSAGDVEMTEFFARCRGKHFRLFDRGRPRVMAVHGEMPWKVRLGETVESSDYVAPPLMLSREKSTIWLPENAAGSSEDASAGGSWGAAAAAAKRGANDGDADDAVSIPLDATDDGSQSPEAGATATSAVPITVPDGAAPPMAFGSTATSKPGQKPAAKRLPKSSRKHRFKAQPLLEEVNYTLSEYVPRAEVAAAFGLTLPMPISIAPNQPYAAKRLYVPLAIAALCVVVAYALLGVLFRPTSVMTASVAENFGGGEFWSEPFELRGWRNIRVQGTTSATDWAYFDGTLRHEGTGAQREFSLGFAAGETRTKYLSAVAAGTYRLKVRPQFSTQPASARQVTVTLSQGAINSTPWVILFVGIAVLALLNLIGQFGFEYSRWSNSDFSPYGSGGD